MTKLQIVCTASIVESLRLQLDIANSMINNNMSFTSFMNETPVSMKARALKLIPQECLSALALKNLTAEERSFFEEQYQSVQPPKPTSPATGLVGKVKKK